MSQDAEPSVEADAQAVLTVDLAALAANWRFLRDRAGSAACGAVVKADAYGTGIEHATPALARAGCRTFFTAHVSEGVRARESLRATGLPDADARVFVLNGFHPDLASPALYRDAHLSAVVGSADELLAWKDAAGADPVMTCALHVDTGMNRLGFDPGEAMRLDAATLAGARVSVVMSHFVAAEEPGNPVNARQVALFDDLRRGPLGAVPGSLANSSGIFLPGRPHYDLVRPGFALYGGNPLPGRPNPMRAVVGLTARILQTRTVGAGEAVGYNGRWIAPRPTRLATIGIGYADGLPRNAKTIGGEEGPVALLAGVPCRLVGRVSMDTSVVDVTDAPAGEVRPGATVEILGGTITVDDLAERTGTIGYEILTSLGRRYRRHYLGGTLAA